MYDLVILGAGPAGCMAAIGALQKDPELRVAIIDPQQRAGHKVGEALLTGTILALEEAGLIEKVARMGFHRKIGAAYVWGEGRTPWYVNYPPSSPDSPQYPAAFSGTDTRYAIHVPRHIFDQMLRDAAEDAGADLYVGTVREVRTANDGQGGVNVVGAMLDDGRTVRARYWIDASGQRAVIANAVTTRQRMGEQRGAKFAYYQDVDWDLARANGFDPHRTNIVSGQHGWFWVIHLGDRGNGLTSVGFVSVPDVLKRIRPDCPVKDIFPEIALFGLEDAVMRDVYGAPMENYLSRPDYSYRSRQLHGANWALAGDAALFLDPILSQGVTLAVHYGLLRGRAAVDALAGQAASQASVSQHYEREAAVLLDVCGTWYDNNRAVADWRLKSAMIGRDLDGVERDAERAFTYITNLENLRHEYDPYPVSEQRVIHSMLFGEQTPG